MQRLLALRGENQAGSLNVGIVKVEVDIGVCVLLYFGDVVEESVPERVRHGFDGRSETNRV